MSAEHQKTGWPPEGLARPGLQVAGLRRRIDSFTLEADFALSPGDRLVIQAPSGAGKSTLLRILAGLEPTDQGTITLDGRELTALPPAQRNIGYLFQGPALFDSLSVLENAAFGLRMRGVSQAERRAKVEPWLKSFGLQDQMNGRVEVLSGGEKQRVALIRALVWGPQLLLLDEPFSALDPALRAVLRQEVLTMLREHPIPLILVTHDPADAEALATRRAEIEMSQAGIRTLQVLI